MFLTQKLIVEPKISENKTIISDPTEDVLKIVVASRYSTEKPAVGFIKGVGLKTGALALSVFHDSHNIVGVGIEDSLILEAMNMVIEAKGGFAIVGAGQKKFLPLPIAGLMSPLPAKEVASFLQDLSQVATILGCKLRSPFMTLSFMGLTVIPELKITDRGLFDVSNFALTSIYADNQNSFF
eukprot:TRINITY_DN43811_c0_g1_i1.p1 TRINITY_DN43811_c0_g1~~TRINITY_DN43811_c0_g1_i1.p1  ORF type:complete len:192 (-),score=35.58 TRINITY_DN43811_c0_g1_i1:9-554(-)